MNVASAHDLRPPAPTRPSHRRRRTRLGAVFALLLAAVVYLLVEGLGSSLNYFDTVAQAVARKDHIGTSQIRLEGLVASGTIRRTTSGADFAVTGGGHRIEVHEAGEPPQLFQANIPVVVVGHFTSASSYLFVSDQILVKHSATYIARHPTRVRSPNGTVR